MTKIKNILKKTALINSDGKLNGKVVASSLSLLILIGQMICTIWGITSPIRWDLWAQLLTLILMLLAGWGILDDPTTVSDKSEDLKVTEKGDVNSGDETSTQK
ncbi:hypothetical protein ACQW5G_00450 [Fructilactobacillus sp. Tb1]|uniref:hypothetical protein n=1 Tax=Fructilactobacillus sp. Tb1 TaxID=3422304 RepID=UPI003D2C8666